MPPSRPPLTVLAAAAACLLACGPAAAFDDGGEHCKVPVEAELDGSSPAPAGGTVTASLQASSPTPRNRRECAITNLSYTWDENATLRSKPTAAADYEGYDGPGSAGVAPKDGAPNGPLATLTAQGLPPGYYEATCRLTATWTLQQKVGCGDCDCSDCEAGGGSVAVEFVVLENGQIGVRALEVNGKIVGTGATVYLCAGQEATIRALPAPEDAQWPAGKPVWGGTAGATGTGGSVSITLPEPAASKDAAVTVTAECGNTVSVDLVPYALEGVYKPEDDFPDRSRERAGVGERIALSAKIDPPDVLIGDLGGLAWEHSGVGHLTIIEGGDAAFDAGATPGTATFTLTAVEPPGACPAKPVSWEVVEPSGVRMERLGSVDLWHRQGYTSMGFMAHVFLEPTDVSFDCIEVWEDTAPHLAGGYFLFLAEKKDELAHDPWNNWGSVGKGVAGRGSRKHGCDLLQFSDYGPGNKIVGLGQRPILQPSSIVLDEGALKEVPDPITTGSRRWEIPWHYRVICGQDAGKPAKPDSQFTTVTQRLTIASDPGSTVTPKKYDGTLVLSKGGASATTNVQSPDTGPKKETGYGGAESCSPDKPDES